MIPIGLSGLAGSPVASGRGSMRTHAPLMDLKRGSSRAAKYEAKYGDRCWEAEAMPSVPMQELLASSIDAYFDRGVRREVEADFPRLRQELRAALVKAGGQLAWDAMQGEDLGEYAPEGWED